MSFLHLSPLGGEHCTADSAVRAGGRKKRLCFWLHPPNGA